MRNGVAVATIALVFTMLSDIDAGLVRGNLKDTLAATPIVVLAEVTAVEGLPHGDWKATGRVVEVWKGQPRDTVSYGPAGHGDTAGCEASAAQMGETVVLLLEPDRIHIFDLLRIRIAGLGRLPVYVVGGKRFVETSAFFVPPNAPTSQVLIGDHTRELVPLDWLRDFVRASTAEASPVDR